MLVLSIDTSWFKGGAALLKGGNLISVCVFPEERKHAIYFPACVQDLFTKAGKSLNSVDLITVALGPGSFTGLRVGLSFAKALSYALKKPLKGVSSLEAIASVHELEGKTVLATIRLRKKQLVGALFRAGIPPTRLSEDLVGDISCLKKLKAEFFIDESVKDYPLFLLTGIAKLGSYLYKLYGSDDPFNLSPLYVRGGQPS